MLIGYCIANEKKSVFDQVLLAVSDVEQLKKTLC
jgi:hypothetical protein